MKIRTLPSGLTVATENIPFVRSVSLGFWIRSGVLYESREVQGASHFIEHLLFKGTPTRSAREISEAFDNVGGEVNAFTAKEYCCFYAKVVDEHLPVAVEILSDMLSNSLLAPEAIAKEKQIVLEEISMYEDSPEELVHDLLAQTLYPDHPLGRSILGTRETIANMCDEDVRQFYTTHFNPANIVVAAAGNLEHESLDAALDEHLQLKNGARAAQSQEVDARKPAVELLERPTEQLHLCLGLPGLPMKDKRVYAWNLLNNVLGSGMSSRLFQLLREEHALVYSAYSYTASFQLSGYTGIYAGLAPQKAEQALELIARVLRDMQDNLIGDDELQRAKEQVKGALVMGLESTANRMSRMGRGLLLLDRVQEVDDIVRKIEAVTADDIRELARELFNTQYLASVGIGKAEHLRETLANLRW